LGLNWMRGGVERGNKAIDKYAEAITDSKTGEEISTVLNKVYEDGFEDGVDEGN